jgi:hypothetical protein
MKVMLIIDVPGEPKATKANGKAAATYVGDAIKQRYDNIREKFPTYKPADFWTTGMRVESAAIVEDV